MTKAQTITHRESRIKAVVKDTSKSLGWFAFTALCTAVVVVLMVPVLVLNSAYDTAKKGAWHGTKQTAENVGQGMKHTVIGGEKVSKAA